VKSLLNRSSMFVINVPTCWFRNSHGVQKCCSGLLDGAEL